MHLKTISISFLFSECPLADIDDYRIETYAALAMPKTLKRLDKDPMDPEEKEEALETFERQKTEVKWSFYFN